MKISLIRLSRRHRFDHRSNPTARDDYKYTKPMRLKCS